MTLSVALDHGLQERLEQLAKARGVEPSEVILQILRKELGAMSSPDSPRFGRMSDGEWRQFSDEWTETHKSVPVLPDEALTRESIYGDHP